MFRNSIVSCALLLGVVMALPRPSISTGDDTVHNTASSTSKAKPDVSKIYGKIMYVNSFPDYKVQIVNSFPDLKVQVVNSFPGKAGKWQIVNSFPDYKIQIVNSFPDFKVQYVNSFPGVP
ncbi:MAG: hypothetical protein VB877_07550 [Pirellulaceae bacterium]